MRARPTVIVRTYKPRLRARVAEVLARRYERPKPERPPTTFAMAA